jgi:hypothetical protein
VAAAATFSISTWDLFHVRKRTLLESTFDRRLKNRKTYDISDIINVIENRKTNG